MPETPQAPQKVPYGLPQPTFQPGQGVSHDKFGTGTVVSVSGNKVTIKFDNGEERTMLDSVVKPSNHEVIPLPTKEKKAPRPVILPSAGFETYLMERGCFLRAQAPPQSWDKFEGLYEEMTGEKPVPGSDGYTRGGNRNTYEYSMGVFFPKPESEEQKKMLPPGTKEVPNSNLLVFYSNKFCWRLIQDGFRLGSNKPQSGGDALMGDF